MLYSCKFTCGDLRGRETDAPNPPQWESFDSAGHVLCDEFVFDLITSTVTCLLELKNVSLWPQDGLSPGRAKSQIVIKIRCAPSHTEL